MRKPIAAFTILLLCLALFASCGTNVGMPNPDAPTINENAPPTTDAEAATEPTATTQEATTLITAEAPTTTTKKAITSTTTTAATIHPKDRDRLLNMHYKMDENGIFYIERPIWMDFFSLNQIVYGTMQVKFQYGQRDWLIQLWKGRYGLVMLGCEIGVAAKPIAQRDEAYSLATPEEGLVFTMDVYQKDFSTNQTKHLFTRGPEKTGWFNGFVPGEFHEPGRKEEIIVIGSIEFPDEEMLRAFEAPFSKAGFQKGSPSKSNPEKYSLNGTTLTFSWQSIDQDA